jgi:pyruvate ferredoxin oxidoreductase gamma subunit
MQKLLEIRWHGRGGQGAKTAATFLAEAVLGAGKYSQGFPEYGPERMGAPMKGFTRISDEPIKHHCGIYPPDVVVVLDPSLLDTVDVTEGLTENGIIIVNTGKCPADIRKKLGLKGRKVCTVDATKISLEEFGRPIPNTPMIGALIRLTGILDLDTIIEDIKRKFAKKFSEKIVEGNINSIKRGYGEVEIE